MKNLSFCLTVLMFSILSAADTKSEKETPSNSNESSNSQESSVAERVIDTIAEAAANDRDYGKDIGDR